MAGVNLFTGKTAWMCRAGNTNSQRASFLPGRFLIGFPMGDCGTGEPLTTAGGHVRWVPKREDTVVASRLK